MSAVDYQQPHALESVPTSTSSTSTKRPFNPDSVRSATLYIRPAIRRWLEWACHLEQMESPDDPPMTQEQMAEELIRDGILAKWPGIQTLDEEYWAGRKALIESLDAKLKAQFKAGLPKTMETP